MTNNIHSKSTLMAMIVAVSAVSLVTAGCSTTRSILGKRDNGSLDYQDSKLLPPIQIPADKQTQAFTPLYPTVDLGESKIELKNESGKQFQLPAPKRTIN